MKISIFSFIRASIRFFMKLLGYKYKSNIKVYLIKETSMGLIYEVQLPIVGSSDVVKRVLKVVVNGEETLKTLEPSDTVNRLSPVSEGSVVAISIKDVDDAGNESFWSDELSFTAKDTIPPATPGQVGVKLLFEVADSAPEPAPAPPPPPPAPEPELELEIPAPAVEDTVPSPSHDD